MEKHNIEIVAANNGLERVIEMMRAEINRTNAVERLRTMNEDRVIEKSPCA